MTSSPQYVRALSVRQPWASLIAEGRKTIELRSWYVHHRGRLAIAAARAYEREGVRLHGKGRGPRRHLVALVDLVDIRPATQADAEAAMVETVGEGLFAWIFRDATPLVAPIPMPGRQGLFSVDVRNVRKLR
jgi:hypothetical protein